MSKQNANLPSMAATCRKGRAAYLNELKVFLDFFFFFSFLLLFAPVAQSGIA